MTTESAYTNELGQNVIGDIAVHDEAQDESMIIQANEYGSVNPEMLPLHGSSEPIIVQTDAYGNIKVEPIAVNVADALNAEGDVEAKAAELNASWQSFQTKTTTLFAQITSSAQELFNNNRQLLTTLGWGVLLILATRLLFAGLDAIDDIPLITPVLKLIGLIYVVRFVWRYLLRQQNRHELMQTVRRTKTEIFGS